MRINTYDLETSKKHVLLVQPNKVTNARYEYDEREENILTLMIEAVQEHMTREQVLQRDLFNQPVISISLDTKQQKNKYLYSLHKMIRKTVSFDWRNETKNCETSTTAVLINAYHDNKGTLSIDITLNTWAIPFLLYWGKGVGGTIYNKRIALTLNGKYAKRIYKLCKRWEDKGGFQMPLDEFRLMLNVPKSYSITKVRERVLDKAKVELMRDADIYYNYSITKEQGSRSYNTVNFKILPNAKNRVIDTKKTQRRLQDKGEIYSFVYRVISLAYSPITSSKAFDIVEKLAKDPEDLKKAYDRFKRIDNLFENQNTNIGLIKYILDTDFGFKHMKANR